MRDLLTNIKKAIDILNDVKGTKIIKPTLELFKAPPVGVSAADWREAIISRLQGFHLYTTDDLTLYVDFTMLDTIDESDPLYDEVMKKLITKIYDAWKYTRDLHNVLGNCPNGGYVNINSTSQTITGSKILSTTGTTSWGNATALQSNFPDLHVAGDVDVKGDIMMQGGKSLSSELDDLRQRNNDLRVELGILRQMLADKGLL